MTTIIAPTVVIPASDTQIPESTPTVANAAPVLSEAAPPSADSPETPAAPSTATSTTVPPSPPAASYHVELIRLLRELLVQEEKQEQPPAKPLIGVNNLIVEGLIKVRSDDAVIVNIPISTMLPGALSPAAIQGAHQQFETIMSQLVIQPAIMAFVDHLASVQAKWKTHGDLSHHSGASYQSNGHGSKFTGKN